MKTKIYVLLDSDGTPKYIGKSNNPRTRLKNHIKSSINKSGRLTRKEAWIKSLYFKNEIPELFIIDEVEVSEWEFWEKHYISLFLSWGFDIKNGTNGGDTGPSALGRKQTPETILKRISKLDYIEIGKKVSLTKSGISLSGEHKEALKKAWQKRKENDEFIPWNKGKFGYTTSKKGQTVCSEQKEKIRKSLTKFIYQQFNLDGNIIKEWSQHELIQNNFVMSNIMACCNNKRKTAYKSIWKRRCV